MQRKGIAFAGNLIVDTIKHIEVYPRPLALTSIRRMAHATGGLACTCSMAMVRLDPDIPVEVIGIVGEDEAGDFILRALAGHPSIDVSGVLRTGETSYTDVMTDPSGGRTFFHFRGANALLSPGHFNFAKVNARILHIGYILLLDALDAEDAEYGTALCRALDGARKEGIETSIDVVSEDGERFEALVRPALRYADYCIINEFEASRTTGIPLRDADGLLLPGNFRAAAEALIQMGVSRWAVIHAPEIACGAERGGAYVERPSFALPDGFIKSSVGAGDAFAAGILHGAYHRLPLSESIRNASAVAAWSLSGEGAADAVMPLDRLIEALARVT